MKIGIIGNMNNAYFSLARYLRDEGYDCELLILANEPAHFDPACDTFSNDHKTYCNQASWGDPAHFWEQNFAIVKDDLARYDFLIGNGPAPAYIMKAGRTLDLFIPYGRDLYALPFLLLVHPRRMLSYVALSYYQRKGIRKCAHILFDRTNAAMEKVIRKLRYPGNRIVSPAPMFYNKEYDSALQKNSDDPLLTKLNKLREENDFLLLQHSRQIWKHSADKWSYKGNNLLISGYAKFIKEHNLRSVKLILLEYGTDVTHTKKLIASLGIEDAVVWFPKMPRNKLMTILAASDLVIGELHHSWLSYGVVLEALSMAKPFMHKRIDAEFSADYPELYPMLHASSAQSVYAGLHKAFYNRESIRNIGEKGKEWYQTYCVQRPLSFIKKIIEQKTLNA